MSKLHGHAHSQTILTNELGITLSIVLLLLYVFLNVIELWYYRIIPQFCMHVAIVFAIRLGKHSFHFDCVKALQESTSSHHRTDSDALDDSAV